MSRIAIVSDIHLGRRQFAAQVNGRNQREVDVEIAWFAAVDRIIAYDPDLVLIGGDITDSVRPSMHAVRAWQLGVRQIVRETDAHVVAVIGNHDGARTAETLTPVIVVQGEPRVHVVTEPLRLELSLFRTEEHVSISCFPFTALTDAAAYRLEPNPVAALNILLMHAAVRSSAAPDKLPPMYAGETAIDVAREADAFDVVALGDYHSFAQLVPGRCVVYPGSLERVASDLWKEAGEEKGFVTYDTETEDLQFVPVPTRPVLDLTLDDFDTLRVFDPVSDVNIALGALTDDESLPGLTNVGGAIVRLRVDDFPRGERDRIDWATVRQLKARCCHMQLDLRFREESTVALGDRREHRSRTLADAAREYFADDPATVRSCAFEYLGLQEAA